MNKAHGMYEMKPLFKLPDKIELPSCMYSMRNIVGSPVTDKRTDCENEILNSIMDKQPLPELSALEARWDSVLQTLSALTKEVSALKVEMNTLCYKSDCRSKFTLNKNELKNLRVLDGAVINANPSNPPYSIFLLNHLYNGFINFSCHVHSNVHALSNELEKLCHFKCSDDSLKITLIWKEGILDSELVLNPIKQLTVRGEVNILRHLGRIGLQSLRYPSENIMATTQIDIVLDLCHRLLHTEATKERASLYRQLNAKLGRNAFYGGENFNICDLVLWSVMKQNRVNLNQDITPGMAKWYSRMDEMFRI